MLFGFLTALLSFFIIEISLAPNMGCDLSLDLFHERKIIQAQKRDLKEYTYLERERNNKDGLSSFQAQAVKINKL
jgi:hypothetical protein